MPNSIPGMPVQTHPSRKWRKGAKYGSPLRETEHAGDGDGRPLRSTPVINCPFSSARTQIRISLHLHRLFRDHECAEDLPKKKKPRRHKEDLLRSKTHFTGCEPKAMAASNNATILNLSSSLLFLFPVPPIPKIFRDIEDPPPTK